MIHITGDIHGEYKSISLHSSSYEDYIIICGDFGVIWDGSMSQEYDLDELNDMDVTVLFLDGNHENYDLLSKYPLSDWKGGKVQFIRDHVIHLLRGQVYEIDGYKIFTMGGAECHDITLTQRDLDSLKTHKGLTYSLEQQDFAGAFHHGGILKAVLEPDDPLLHIKMKALRSRRIHFRVNHLSWWKEELPTEEELQEGLRNLQRHGNKVDVILSHCGPTSLQNAIGATDYPVNHLTEYFEMLMQTIDYKLWCFGHYHENKVIDDKHTLLYYGYIDLNKTLEGGE